MKKFTKEQILYLEKYITFISSTDSDYMRIIIVGKPTIFTEFLTIDTNIKCPKDYIPYP